MQKGINWLTEQKGKKAVPRLRVCPQCCLASTLLTFRAHGLVLCLLESTQLAGRSAQGMGHSTLLLHRSMEPSTLRRRATQVPDQQGAGLSGGNSDPEADVYLTCTIKTERGKRKLAILGAERLTLLGENPESQQWWDLNPHMQTTTY